MSISEINLKEMKESIDIQLSLGVGNPRSLGLLVEGFNCTLFYTILFVDGIYCLIVIKRFCLVEGIYDLINLPSVVEVFTYVKNGLDKFVEEVENKRKRKEKEKMEERICPSFVTNFVNK
ncbi:hypothetical protein INT48_000548 [Thamnidium elegans]|uniref:Uncharacterized protein n=1 Tax=Thamnidium elegans TaxID=101142 RepID=A0A8H7SUV6_9FUNG|nr:hypothetical protein INT48_000548 [Thamnidium elegans]